MKKRLISLLLTVLMVAGMFSCMTVSASAAYDKSNMLTYSMKSGDNVYTVCRSKGIDFYANYDLITNVNGIKNYSAIAPGTVIYLPKPGEKYVDDGKSTGTGTGTGSSTPASNVTVPSTDFVAYYLIPYKMQSGDTVYNVCRSLGISFNSYSEQIKAINNLKSYSGIQAGTTLLLPSSTAPASAGGAYKVMGHKMISGETVGGVVKTYNMDYNSNAAMLQKINNKTNLNYIQAGQVLYVAIPASAGGSGSGSSSGSGTVAPSPAPSASNTYAITLAAATNGSVSCQLNGKAVTGAASGATVVVVPKANSGCSVESISVTKNTNGASVTVSESNTFTMPNCDVTVKVSFTTKHRIYFNNHGNGEAGGLINGALGFWASKGQTVGIKTESHKGYYVKSYTVTSNKTGAQIASSNGSFVMPDNDVTVDVYFEKSATKSYYMRHDTGKGSFETTVNGVAVDVARPGDTVKVIPLAGSGKEIDTISYWRQDNSQTYKLKNTDSFVMPESDVAISVTFRNSAAYNVNINVTPAGSGTAVAQVSGKDVTTAISGATVAVVPTPASGYRVKAILADGTDITAAGSYKMPAKTSTVWVEFESVPANTIKFNLPGDGTVTSAIAKVNGRKVTQASANDLVELEVTCRDGYSVDGLVVFSDGKVLKGFTEGSTAFIMPDAPVEVNITTVGSTYNVDAKAINNGTVAFTQSGRAITSAKAGSTVNVEVSPNADYKVTGAYFTYMEDGEEKKVDFLSNFTGNSGYFTMRSADVMVYIELGKNAYTITRDSSCGTDVQEANITVSGNPCLTPKVGDTVRVVPTVAGGFNYTVTVVDTDTGNIEVAKKTNGEFSFTMPAYNVTIKVETAANMLTFSETTDGGKITSDSKFTTPNVGTSSQYLTVESAYITIVDADNAAVTPGAWVVIEPKFYEHGTGIIYDIVVKDGSGKEIAKNRDNGVSFAMPSNGASVKVTYFE